MSLPPIHRAPGQDGEARSARKEPQEARQGGRSFADVFAAIAGPRADASSFLGAQALPEGTAQGPVAVAEMFNENGLLGHAAPVGLSMVVDQVAAAGAEPAPAHEIAKLGAGASIDAGAAPVTAGSTPGDAVQAGPVHGVPARVPAAQVAMRSVPVAPRFAALPAPPLALEGQASIAAKAEPDAARAQRSAPPQLKALLQDYLRERGSSNAQINVQAGEEGLSVVARLDKLSREERVRLRSGIVDLLARHGMAAAHIWLNGTRYGGESL